MLGTPSCRELRFGTFDDSDLVLWEMNDPPVDIDLYGYFQELPACWERHRSFLRRLFQLIPQYAHGIERWHQDVTHGGQRTLVAVHVRRADYRQFDLVPGFDQFPKAWYVSRLRQIWPSTSKSSLVCRNPRTRNSAAGLQRVYFDRHPINAPAPRHRL